MFRAFKLNSTLHKDQIRYVLYCCCCCCCFCCFFSSCKVPARAGRDRLNILSCGLDKKGICVRLLFMEVREVDWIRATTLRKLRYFLVQHNVSLHMRMLVLRQVQDLWWLVLEKKSDSRIRVQDNLTLRRRITRQCCDNNDMAMIFLLPLSSAMHRLLHQAPHGQQAQHPAHAPQNFTEIRHGLTWNSARSMAQGFISIRWWGFTNNSGNSGPFSPQAPSLLILIWIWFREGDPHKETRFLLLRMTKSWSFRPGVP